MDVIKDLHMNYQYDQELAVKTYEMFKEYMLSDKETFEELEIYNDKDNEKYRPSHNRDV